LENNVVLQYLGDVLASLFMLAGVGFAIAGSFVRRKYSCDIDPKRLPIPVPFPSLLRKQPTPKGLSLQLKYNLLSLVSFNLAWPTFIAAQDSFRGGYIWELFYFSFFPVLMISVVLLIRYFMESWAVKKLIEQANGHAENGEENRFDLS
jgi:hypothetical protein